MKTLLKVIGWLLAVTLITLYTFRTPDTDPKAMIAKYGAPPSKFLKLGDGQIVHMRDEGPADAPVLVLLHGSNADLHTWDAWTEAMKDHRRVVRLDLPGFGLTGPAPDGDYRAVRLARVASAFLDHLQIPQADVAGNSLGGRVAAELVLAHPQQVRRLILLDAAGLTGHTPPPIFRFAQIPVLNKLLTLISPRFLVRGNVEQVYGDPNLVTDELVDRYQAILLREGNRQAFVDRAMQLAEDDGKLLRKIGSPTLILWGRHDRWIPVEQAENFRKKLLLPQVKIYENAGHIPHEEIPAESLEDALKFLR